jgi:hypothetical protein
MILRGRLRAWGLLNGRSLRKCRLIIALVSSWSGKWLRNRLWMLLLGPRNEIKPENIG